MSFHRAAGQSFLLQQLLQTVRPDANGASLRGFQQMQTEQQGLSQVSAFLSSCTLTDEERAAACAGPAGPCCPSNTDVPHNSSMQKVDRKPFCRDNSTCFYNTMDLYFTLDIYAGVSGGQTAVS
jgi:hypothetical protein